MKIATALTSVPAYRLQLVGEAFNVAPSFFQGKKRSALKKLREQRDKATYRIIMLNSDASP